MSRFWKFAIAGPTGSAVPFQFIANDGNLVVNPIDLLELDEQGSAERYDIVVDFSMFGVGDTVHFVNLADHFDPEAGELNGKKPVKDLTVAEALSGSSPDPCVGRFIEFRVVRRPAVTDQSRIPSTLIPNPDLSKIPIARERVFEFGRGAKGIGNDPWGIRTDNGDTLAAEFNRLSAAPRLGTREIWTLRNGGGGWDHPIHIHFEEGQILARDGSAANVPLWERGRKDVYRLRPSGTVTLTMQFRDWGGMFMEHCHNTVHEDHAMLLRWEIDDGGAPFLRPLPSPVPTPQGVTFEETTDVLPTAL
jgi:FtsP/CotA-like multicopper oxidase with cupredoxin domain